MKIIPGFEVENTGINIHTELLMRIENLKVQKAIQEEGLKVILIELTEKINPISFVKDSLHELAVNREVQFDLAKVALNMGANLVIDQVLGKYRSIKGFFSSVLIEKFSTAFINSNASKIFSGFGKKKHNSQLTDSNE